jgi:hypothetical protein
LWNHTELPQRQVSAQANECWTEGDVSHALETGEKFGGSIESECVGVEMLAPDDHQEVKVARFNSGRRGAKRGFAVRLAVPNWTRHSTC